MTPRSIANSALSMTLQSRTPQYYLHSGVKTTKNWREISSKPWTSSQNCFSPWILGSMRLKYKKQWQIFHEITSLNGRKIKENLFGSALSLTPWCHWLPGVIDSPVSLTPRCHWLPWDWLRMQMSMTLQRVLHFWRHVWSDLTKPGNIS